MGTNYYHRTNLCDCCGRYDERHIGKSLTMFQGYRPDRWEGGETADIQSWEDWKKVLREGGDILDEYGVKQDVEQFIADVEATDRQARGKQFRWIVDNSYNPVLEDGTRADWMDADGFSFHNGDFS